MSPAVSNAPAPTSQPPAELPDWLTFRELPSLDRIVDYLLELGSGDFGAVVALLIFACGLVYMLQGWKVFKVLVVANAAVLGAMVGGRFGALLRGPNMWLFGGIAGSLLFAILAWPLMKYAVSLMGGLVGSFLGFATWHYATNALDRTDLTQHAWAGAVIGLITLGLLAFVIFKFVVTLFTAVQGSMMAVGGVVTLLLKYEPLRQDLEPQLRGNSHLVALVIAVPALIGLAFQYSGIAKKAQKKKKATEGGG